MKKEEREHYYCPSGDKEFPIFEYDEKGELVDTGKKTNVFDKIQSYEDDVLLSNIIKRCALTGDTLEASKEAFGDSRLIPQDLLEVKKQSQRVQGFVDSLSDDDLKLLNEKGFDAFISEKIAAKFAAKSVEKEGDKNE